MKPLFTATLLGAGLFAAMALYSPGARADEPQDTSCRMFPWATVTEQAAARGAVIVKFNAAELKAAKANYTAMPPHVGDQEFDAVYIVSTEAPRRLIFYVSGDCVVDRGIGDAAFVTRLKTPGAFKDDRLPPELNV